MDNIVSETTLRLRALRALNISEDDADKKIELIEEWIKENNFPEQMSEYYV